MNIVNFNERACDRYRRYFDAYLDNEILIETSQDVLQHLNSCRECARILEGRARAKQRVRDAVTKAQAPPEFVAALRSRLRKLRSFFVSNTVRWTMAAAAVLLQYPHTLQMRTEPCRSFPVPFRRPRRQPAGLSSHAMGDSRTRRIPAAAPLAVTASTIMVS
jgi:predicted anti-sigma-YlaC factor YlaD